MEGLGGTLCTGLKPIDHQCTAQREQAKVCTQCTNKAKWMPLTDGGYEKHASRMHEPADYDGHCQTNNEGAGSNRVEVEKASHKQGDVLRSIAVSANCLRKRRFRYCGIAAAFAPNSGNVEA